MVVINQLVQVPATARSPGLSLQYLQSHILVLSLVLMLEVTQLQQELDHPSEGLKTICGFVFFSGFVLSNETQLAVWLHSWECWCKGEDGNTWPVKNCSVGWSG